jgi:hypothetical protein
MLTLEELQASTINVTVAREAYTQVDRHLIDILEVRKSFEQKAATLMGAYIIISVALFGIGGAMFKDVGSKLQQDVAVLRGWARLHCRRRVLHCRAEIGPVRCARQHP